MGRLNKKYNPRGSKVMTSPSKQGSHFYPERNRSQGPSLNTRNQNNVLTIGGPPVIKEEVNTALEQINNYRGLKH